MKKQLPLVAAIFLAFAGGFSVAPQKGGDRVLVANDSRPTGTDAPSTAKGPSDSGVEPPPTVVPPESISQLVHAITVRDGGTAGTGSATHIGGGVYLTCKHVFNRPATALEIDGKQFGSNWWTHPTMDVAIVHVMNGPDASDASVNTAALTDGQSLRIVGQKTGLHAGVLTATRWKSGVRTVDCAVSTESGDSGAGVFNEAGELVGVHWGSNADGVFFTPLSEVAAFVAQHSSVPQPVAAADDGDTGICKCLGYRGKDHCYCLQKGVPCRCNSSTGSEWNMDDNGRPVSKTGKYANPNQQPAQAPMTLQLKPRSVRSAPCPNCRRWNF